MARSIIASVITASLVLVASACDKKENPYAVPEKKTVDVHKLEVQMSEEELIEARKAAGIKSFEEEVAENAQWYENECRKYVKARLPEYRQLVADLRGFLDDIEKQAPRWKDDAAFAKYDDKYKPKAKDFTKTYNEVTGDGGEGGNLQLDLSAAFRAWEQLNADIGPGVADNEALPGALQEIRGHLDKVVAALDEIEKDDSIVPDEPAAEGDDAKKE